MLAQETQQVQTAEPDYYLFAAAQYQTLFKTSSFGDFCTTYLTRATRGDLTVLTSTTAQHKKSQPKGN